MLKLPALHCIKNTSYRNSSTGCGLIFKKSTKFTCPQYGNKPRGKIRHGNAKSCKRCRGPLCVLSEECDSSRAIQFLTTQHHEELNLQSSPFTYSLCSKNICVYMRKMCLYEKDK